MISLEPVDLVVLAEHLRDGTWLDVRVCDVGVLERVQVAEIVVHREGDQLRFIQEVVDGDEVLIQGYLVDNDSIMYARPTVFETQDVTPPEPPPRIAKQSAKFGGNLDPEQFSILVNAVHGLHAVRGLEPHDLLRRLEDEWAMVSAWVKHYLLWTLYELTNLSQQEVCTALGYGSPTPWHSTKHEVSWDDEKRKEIKAVVIATQRRMGTRLAFRTDML